MPRPSKRWIGRGAARAFTDRGAHLPLQRTPRSDKQVYRSKEEVKEWQARDPIARFERYLIEHNLLTRDEADAIRARAYAAVEEAVAFADASPEPDPATLLDEVLRGAS